ncbi:hypothetical protein L842_2156 [Mycobacterium intracellulare MIN_052511_1280]|nr:hypothetical protein L842_2156 [Mycobacterium intracellulare MIN_052511_1280]
MFFGNQMRTGRVGPMEATEPLSTACRRAAGIQENITKWSAS